MKKIVLLFLTLFLPVVCVGQSLDLPLIDSKLDLSGLVGNLHPCYVYDQHRDNLLGAYLPAVQFHDASNNVFVSLNGGFVWEASSGIGGPMALLGFRVDNLVSRIMTQSWVKSHVNVTKVPSVEVGPFGGYINRLGWLYGFFVSKKLG